MSVTSYKKGKGKAGVEGIDFQLDLLTATLINALCNHKGWKLSTENKEAGKYDDIVIELSDGSAVLVQSKHKENKKISKEQLFSCNSKNVDFSLPKYFFSFEEIKRKFRATVVICTNTAIVTKDLRNSLTAHSATPDNMFYYEGCSFFTFNENIVPDLKKSARVYIKKNLQGKSIDEAIITDENLKDFLENFHFFANYPSGQELHKIIEHQLSQFNNFKLSYNDIYRKIKEWFTQPKGDYLTELNAMAMLCEIRSDKYCESLKNYCVSFESNDFDCTDSKLIIHIKAEGSYLLHTLKIFHKFQQDIREKLYVNPDDDVDVQKQMIETFSQPRYVFLVVNSSKNIRGNDIDEMSKKLREILQNFQYKKIILVGNDKLARHIELKDISSVDGSITFQDFSKEYQKSLLQRQIILFQGKITNLEDLLLKQNIEEYTQSLNLETLEKLVKGEVVKVGVQVLDLNEDKSRYYINRTFQRKTNKRGRIEDTFPEENIFGVNEKLVLISDSAGSGKSTVLTKLAVVVKEQHLSLWVIRINLNDYTRFLRDSRRIQERRRAVNIIDFLCSQEATSLTDFEQLVFSMEGKIVLLMDGVDEVSPDYTELMLDILVQCQNSTNLSKVFVTTRPHICLELEEVLKVKAFRMLPFTEQNQINFLTKYWARNIDIAYEFRCEQYAKALIAKMSTWIKSYDLQGSLAAIPLQVEMLAEIFEENIKLDGLDGDESVLQLPEKFDITKLYDMFVEKKREVFIGKGKPGGNTLSERAIGDQFEKCLAYHTSLSLETILSQTERELFSNCSKGEKSMETYLLKIGIAQKSDQGEIQLIHRTFAEYFVAKSVLKEIQLENRNVEFCRFLVDELLLKAEFEVIRAFFDSLLRKVNLPPGIFKNYLSFRYKTDLRYWKNNENLIFVLSMEGCVATLQLILKSINFDVVKGKEINIKSWQRVNLKAKNTLKVLLALLRKGGINIKDENGCTPLHRSVSACHFEMAEFLVEQGANVDIKDEENNTPLILAAGESCLDIVKLLVQHDATVNVKNFDGRTALHLAAECGCLDTLMYLAVLVEDYDIKDNDGRTPLHLAVQRNHLEAVKHLVGLGVDFNIRDKDGSTILHLACARGYVDVVNYSVGLNIDINIKDKHGQTALHVASACGYLEVVEYITKKLNIDPNVKDDEGHTALHLAIMNGYLHIVKYLKKYDPQLSIKDNEGRSALHLAVASGSLDAVLEIGGNVNIPDKNGCTALHLAAGKGYIDIARHLMESGADINVKDNQGRTVLHFAALTNDLSCIEYLTKSGADRNATDNRGCTVLHLAAADGYLDSIKFLVELGVDFNIKDTNGRSAFHFAALKGRVHALEYLIKQKVDLNVRDNDGESALHYAVLNDRMEAVEYLLKLGIDLNVKNNNNRTVLHIAALNGKLDTIEYLLRLGVDSDIKDENGNTAFDYIENRDFVEYFVELESSRRNSVSAIIPFLEGIDIIVADNLAYVELIGDVDNAESLNTNGDQTDYLRFPVEPVEKYMEDTTQIDNAQDNGDFTHLTTGKSDLDTVKQSNINKYEHVLEVNNNNIDLHVVPNGVPNTPNTLKHLTEDTVNVKSGDNITTATTEEHNTDDINTVNSLTHLPATNHNLNVPTESIKSSSDVEINDGEVHMPPQPDTGQGSCPLCAVI